MSKLTRALYDLICNDAELNFSQDSSQEYYLFH